MVGVRMDRRFLLWENPRDAILTIVGLLMVIGCINVYSASFVQADAMMGDGRFYLKRYIAWAALGSVAMYFIGFKLDYRKFLTKRFCAIAVAFTALLLLGVMVGGEVVNGARRWLRVGPLQLQPSELAKAVEVLFASYFLGGLLRRGVPVRMFSWRTCHGMAVACLFAFFIILQPDMATMGIAFGLMWLLYAIAGMPGREFVITFVCIFLGAAALAIKSPYRLQRLMFWLDPWKDAQGSGYQLTQSLLAIGSGGATGLPWGQGISKFFYLPESHTDFAFAIFCQEWGFLGALVLIALVVTFGAALLRIAFTARDPRGFILVTGVSVLLVGQGLANMMMVTGCLPVFGVPLMFISYGGTSMVINMVCIGLVLSVYRKEVEGREEIRARLEQGLPPQERPGVRLVARDGRRLGR